MEAKREKKEIKMSLALRQSKAVSKREMEIASSLRTPDSPRAMTREVILADRRK